MIELFKEKIGVPMADYSISPLGRWLNGTLLAVEKDTLKASFLVREDMCNPAQILHGGIASTILDEIAGLSVFLVSPKMRYVSVNLSVDFLFSANKGETVIAEAKLIRLGKKIAHVEATICTEKGILIAKCATNLINTSTPMNEVL